MVFSRVHPASLALLIWAACSTSTDAPGGPSNDQTGSSSTSSTSAKHDAGGARGTGLGSDPGGGGDVDAGAGSKAGVDRGLPCDVAAVLDQHCAECHGSTPAFGAPFSLVTRDDLLTAVADQGGKQRLEVAMARVQNDAMPMPPAPNARLAAADIGVLQSYLTAGIPESSDLCSTGTAGDGGAVTISIGTDLPKPDDCANTYELKAHGGTTASDPSKFDIAASPVLEGNEYYCFYFDPPYGSDQAMYWFESILDDQASLHHWILYGTDNKSHTSGTSAGCNASEPGAYYIAGWAPGATNRAVGSDIALQMPSGPSSQLILEIHYFNNSGVAQQDASGVRFCTGEKTGRDHLAAVHTLGTEGICIPPGETKDAVGTCSPRTDMGEAHITGVWPHMHKTGRHMKVTVKRKDGTSDVIHDDAFDFNSQIFYPMTDDVVVHAGDSVETTCTYTNGSASQVHYGERTQDEMCYAFIPAWPAGALAAAPTGFSNPTTDIGNRCADALSILQSCNGLADAPKNVAQPQ